MHNFSSLKNKYATNHHSLFYFLRSINEKSNIIFYYNQVHFILKAAAFQQFSHLNSLHFCLHSVYVYKKLVHLTYHCIYMCFKKIYKNPGITHVHVFVCIKCFLCLVLKNCFYFHQNVWQSYMFAQLLYYIYSVDYIHLYLIPTVYLTYIYVHFDFACDL